MIKIHKSPTADTRTCDVAKVTKEQLAESSRQHIEDVQAGLAFFCKCLLNAGKLHDFTKLTDIDQFFSDFKTGFKEHSWLDMHQRSERHHINSAGGVPKDVDLLDVLEYITDCVMAGMARSGTVYELKLSDELLQRAFQNTVNRLKSQVVVVNEGDVERSNVYEDYRDLLMHGLLMIPPAFIHMNAPRDVSCPRGTNAPMIESNVEKTGEKEADDGGK